VPAPNINTIRIAVVWPLTSPTVSRNGRSLHVAPPQVDTLNRLLDAVDDVAPADATVFVGAQDMSQAVLPSSWLYHLMPDRRVPFRYTEFLPGSTELKGSGLSVDIEAADVLVLEDLREVAAVLTPYVTPGDQEANQVVAAGTLLHPYALTIWFARRFATYKRADLFFRQMDLLAELVNDPQRPVHVLAPAYPWRTIAEM